MDKKAIAAEILELEGIYSVEEMATLIAYVEANDIPAASEGIGTEIERVIDAVAMNALGYANLG